MIPTSPINHKLTQLRELFAEPKLNNKIINRVYRGWLFYRIPELLLIQKNITEELYHASNNKKRLSILNENIQYKNERIIKSDLLRKNNYTWGAWLFLNTILFLIAPFSIPALLYWSKKHRNTLYFWKTTNAILVDNILIYCQQSNNSEHKTMDTQNEFEMINLSSSSVKTIEKTNTYTLVSEMPSHERECQNNIQSLGNVLPSLPTTNFFKQYADVSRQRNTGIPEIIDFRLIPTNNDIYSIHLICHFKWTDHSNVPCLLELVKEYTLPIHYRPYPKNIDPLASPPPPKRLFEMFSEKPEFEALLAEADHIIDLSDKETQYLKAYAYATMDDQQVLVLERLINAYHASYEYKENLYNRRNKKNDVVLNQLLEKINFYLSHLPKKYQESSATALIINEKYRVISFLIQEGKFDDAWTNYQPVSMLSHFIKRAFPNLEAMRRQLSAIFIMTNHKTLTGKFPIFSTHRLELIKFEFKKIQEILQTYQLNQSACIMDNIHWLSQLETEGRNAAKLMSPEVSDYIYFEDIRKRREGANDLMDDEGPRVVELVDEETSEYIRPNL